MSALPEEQHHAKDVVDVTYNGVDKDVSFVPQESMQALLDQSLNAYAITANRHLMALWTTGNVELPITGSVADAGVAPGQTLVLRPSAVRGG